MGRISGVMERTFPVIGLALPTIALALYAATESVVFQRRVTELFINLILVLGLFMFMGNSGIVSFGHMAFMGLGAYAAVLLTIPPDVKARILPALPAFLAQAHLPFIMATVVAALFVAVVGYVIGYPIMRLEGVAAAVTSFAILIIVQAVLENWDTFTRGTRTMIGVPRVTTLWVVALWALVTLATAWWFKESRVGLWLRASREDPHAAEAVGIAVVRLRRIAFGFSAFFVAIGGVLWAHYVGAFVPSAFFLGPTFLVLVMLIVGGTSSVAGAAAGAAAITALTELLRSLERGTHIAGVRVDLPLGITDLALGGALIAILILRPDGLVAGRELTWPRRWGRRSPPGGTGVIVVDGQTSGEGETV